ncbi:hypothetical protein DSCW_20220 [Desulfosarcina widdelii]|uniref:Uncharacterized protein n=1 Tax=Desulfosarcina widdelii TaxID=947919 RepID=A0A5K7Z1L3_9BACT|nr:hypothetical protein DSCW_20220 [Desulfosarcina widdelii]
MAPVNVGLYFRTVAIVYNRDGKPVVVLLASPEIRQPELLDPTSKPGMFGESLKHDGFHEYPVQ